MFTPPKSTQNGSSKAAQQKEIYLAEKLALFSSLFFIAFGIGLITDGKKIYANQIKLSQRVDFKATLNPYQ